jgi:integration host factor subunit alpha
MTEDAEALPDQAGKAAPSGGRNASAVQTVTRADLLDHVHAACPALSRGEARDIFETALTEISSALAQGESVSLRAFGTFAVRHKRARVGRNPRTGKEAPITPRRVLTFKASSVLVDTLNRRASSKRAESHD